MNNQRQKSATFEDAELYDGLTLAGMSIGGVYSYIHVLPDEFLFKSNSN